MSELHCEDLCLRFPRCMAYNYKYLGSGEKHACDLLDRVVDVEHRAGFSFRFFERDKVLQVRCRTGTIEVTELQSALYHSCAVAAKMQVKKFKKLTFHPKR